MSPSRTTYYIVMPGGSDPWWHAAENGGLTLFGCDPTHRYRRDACGYTSREAALEAIPAIVADAFRTSLSDPALEVVTRAELFHRLGRLDPGDPSPLPTLERLQAEAEVRDRAHRLQLKPAPHAESLVLF